jgi:vitamin B12 transporter
MSIVNAAAQRGGRSLSITILLSAVPLARALAQAPASQVVELPPIVVSATGIPTPADQVASSVTVITADDLQREQRRTLPDALASVPGLNIVQSGGPGGLTSVFMRGTNSNHVKVLIDGIDATDPSSPNQTFDFGQLLTSDIERIEVLRGPQSGLYGADAIGGVISITTKKGEGSPKAHGSAEGGSFGTFNQTAGLSGSVANFNYAFNVAHYRSTDTPVTPLELLPPGRQRINDRYDNWTYSTRLGADLSDTFGVNVVARYIDSKLSFTGDDFSVFPSVPAASQGTQVDHQLFTRGEAAWSLLDGRFKTYFGIGYADALTWSQSPGFDPTTNKGDRVKLDWRGVATLDPDHTLVLGLENETFRLRTDTTSAQNANQAAYVELQSRFAERVFLVSNLRHDENDAFGGHATWRIAPAVILPGTETRLKASYGTGFKAPSLSQLYVNFPAFNFFGNPNLKPEESTGYDVGFEQPIANDRLRFGATYFHNDITNLITSTRTSYINIGQATTRGVEAFATVALTDQLTLRADYTYTVAINDITGRPLLRRPKNKASLAAGWEATDQLTLSSTILYVGSWVDISRDGSVSGINAPATTVVNMAANYAATEHLSVFGRIDNLFNRRYQDPIGFDRRGLGVFGGLRVTN